jgi:RHS repeat-associated protein
VVTEKYVLGQSGEQVTQLDGLDHWQHTNVYADGQLLATYDQEGTQQPLHFNIADPLGTKRVQAAASGAVELTCVNLPFGDFPSQNCTGPGQEATKHFFTGKERDTESGLDYFGARYYASSMGRFMSPDWADKPEAVPYSDLTNPQSLNLYGYVNNNPLGKADPDGHCCEAEIEEGLKWASETSAGQAVGNTIGAAGIALGAFVSTHASEIIDANMSVGGVSSSPYYGPGINNMGSTLMRSGAQSGTPNPQPSSQPGGTANPGPDGPYKRPNNTTTQAQRDSVQGKPCATCGATGQKNNADHKDPLVEQHYRGGIDKDKMRSPGAVQPQCQSCSNQQGGYLRTFSQAMKRLFGFN